MSKFEEFVLTEAGSREAVLKGEDRQLGAGQVLGNGSVRFWTVMETFTFENWAAFDSFLVDRRKQVNDNKVWSLRGLNDAEPFAQYVWAAIEDTI